MKENMNKVEVLRKAKELISDPEHWCKDDNSLDVNGKYVTADSPHAHSFCIYGAISKYDPDGHEEYFYCYPKVKDFLASKGLPFVAQFNDDEDTTHEDVMKFFDIAIESAK